jgi:hypothetical protein
VLFLVVGKTLGEKALNEFRLFSTPVMVASARSFITSATNLKHLENPAWLHKHNTEDVIHAKERGD